jgi:hypothetical protein
MRCYLDIVELQNVSNINFFGNIFKGLGLFRAPALAKFPSRCSFCAIHNYHHISRESRVPGQSRQEDLLDFTGIQASPYKIGIVSFRHSAILLLRCLPGARSCIVLRQPSAASMCLKRPSMLLGGAANILLLKLCAVCCQHIDSRVGVHHPLHRACMTRVFIHVQRRLQVKDALITAL